MGDVEQAVSVRGEEPALRQRARGGWKGWVILWGVVVALQVVLLSNGAAADTFLWRTTRWFTGDQDKYRWNDYKMIHAGDQPVGPFYTHVDPPFTRVTQVKGQPYLDARIYHLTEPTWQVLRDFGAPLMSGILVVVVFIYDRRRWKGSAIFVAAVASTGALGWVIRAIGGRYRPDAVVDPNGLAALDGVSQWHFWRGFSETHDLSWPSGHATLAFATAAALTYLSPKGKWLFVAIATGCAVTRVVMQAHFYSDVMFGGALGWTVGWVVAGWMDRVIKDPTEVPDVS